MTHTASSSQPPAACPAPSIDLTRAARRAADLPEGCSEADIERAVTRYRGFSRLVQLAPTTPIAPTRDIDFIWHLHMQRPRAYHRDCMGAFGMILDHDGGFGQTPDEEPALIACGRQRPRGDGHPPNGRRRAPSQPRAGGLAARPRAPHRSPPRRRQGLAVAACRAREVARIRLAPGD